MRKKIKLNRQVYNVAQIANSSIMDLDGMTDFNTNTITLNKSLAVSQEETTLAHEILHVLFHQSGACEVLGAQEEIIVRSMEDVFYSFLKDNTNFYD